MTKKELLARQAGIEKWLRANTHNPQYPGVAGYYLRLTRLIISL